MDGYIFDENNLFIQAIAQCFMKEKFHENKHFMLKSKYSGKRFTFWSHISKCCASETNLKLWTNFTSISLQRKRRITVNWWCSYHFLQTVVLNSLFSNYVNIQSCTSLSHPLFSPPLIPILSLFPPLGNCMDITY